MRASVERVSVLKEEEGRDTPVPLPLRYGNHCYFNLPIKGIEKEEKEKREEEEKSKTKRGESLQFINQRIPSSSSSSSTTTTTTTTTIVEAFSEVDLTSTSNPSSSSSSSQEIASTSAFNALYLRSNDADYDTQHTEMTLETTKKKIKREFKNLIERVGLAAELVKVRERRRRRKEGDHLEEEDDERENINLNPHVHNLFSMNCSRLIPVTPNLWIEY